MYVLHLILNLDKEGYSIRRQKEENSSNNDELVANTKSWLFESVSHI